MTRREPDSMVGQVTLAIDHFNRRSSAEALRRHGRAQDSTRFEMRQIVRSHSVVRTRGELVNRRAGVRRSLVLAWNFDVHGKLARIEAYPSNSETPTPLAATHKRGRRRFSLQEAWGLPERMERV
jgi:hypothetical protein